MQDAKIKVSIITPIYNGENDVRGCFDCVSSQTYPSIEWVIIDDGSTDNTVSVINEIISENSKDNLSIKLIEQSNKGAAMARYNGILNTDGYFISILDCDDYLSEDAIELAVKQVELNKNIEFVCYDVANIIAGEVTSKFNFSVHQWPFSGKSAFGLCIDGWGIHGWALVKKSVILKAYKEKELLSDDDIYMNNVNDDELVSRFAMYNSNLVGHCKGLYFYVENPNSTTNAVNKSYHKVCLNEIKLDYFIRKNEISLIVESNKHLLSTFWGVFSRLIKWRSELDNKSEWKTTLHSLADQISLRVEVKSLKLKRSSVKSIIKIITVYLFRVVG